MINWKRLSSGEYISEDKRWYILNIYDRVYGDCWRLSDKNDTRNIHYEQSLKECKRIAERTINIEEGNYKSIISGDIIF